MEANELRLGNWVQLKCVSEVPIVVDIWDNQEFTLTGEELVIQ